MADDDARDGEAQRPSLEPPKLFRRRPRKTAAAPAASDPATEPDTAEPDPSPVSGVGDSALPDETDVVDDPAAVESLDSASEEEAATTPEPVVAPAPARETAPERETAPAHEQAEERPGFTDAATVPVHVGGDHDERAPDPAPEPASRPSPEPAATPREPRTPVLVGRNAALLAGLLVGVLMLLLGAGATSTCEAVRGTSACGAALGIPLLAVVVAIAIVAGALLLRLWHLPSPGSTSFMAVALVAVVTGLFLGEALESWVTRIAFPFGVALAFLAAWWLTVSFDDPDVVRRAREDRERQQV